MYSDVTAIIHSASPFVLSVNNLKKDLLEPATEVTLTVLRAWNQSKAPHITSLQQGVVRV
ncbi:hypothetical protein BT96DRAFT_999461 [Gymnopus androsaceus JB14]|uniref:Thioester reductase (TE) domain-containing protein n=1 Tax=Gymnopus androsaceus JB14 TaxID=1447944 RepID=A0A6A4H7W3_9AGAR|nr:hypothetical protein BT96DRAFT_999461 [Gymnopus androsaceus JB14]